MNNNKANKNLDTKLGEKLIGKHGFSLDTGLVFLPFDKIHMKDLIRALRGIIAHGGLGIQRECDIEEYIEKSYSGYLRRFGRAKRKLIIEQYGELYADTLGESHKALLTDKPSVTMEDDEVLVELKGGYMDYDQYSDPRFVMIQKVGISPNHTIVRIIYNSRLPKEVWSEFYNINLLMSSVISHMYECDVIYGRATCLSLMGEASALISRGKCRDIVETKGIFQEELAVVGTTINELLNQLDIEIATLYAARELRAISDSIEGICERAGAKDSFYELIKYLERETLPEVKKKGTIPRLTVLKTFSEEFILKETSISKEDLHANGNQVLDSLTYSLTHSVASYLTYSVFLTRDPNAESSFLVLKPLRAPTSAGDVMENVPQPG